MYLHTHIYISTMYTNEMKLFFGAAVLTAIVSKKNSCKLLGNRKEMAVALNMPWLGSATRKGLENVK